MNTNFFKSNKDVFLKYFDDSESLTASQRYDQMINNGQFETMKQIIRSKSEFSLESARKALKALY